MPSITAPPPGTSKGTWTFITNHAAALLAIAANPRARISEIAQEVDVTERAALRIVRDLEHAGYIEVHRRGRRNEYRVLDHTSMRHHRVRDIEVHRMLDLLGD
jgi:predicted transcriptional regulator